MVLATVVHTAAADARALPLDKPRRPDLSWRSKAAHALCPRRGAYFARRAATAIHSLDWLSGALPATPPEAQQTPEQALQTRLSPLFIPPAQQPAHSTHQHSAP